MSKAYPSNLTLEQFELLSPLIPLFRCRVVVPARSRCGISSTLSSICCVRAVAGAHYLGTFPTGKRSTPISVTGALMELGCKFMLTCAPGVRLDNARELSPSEVIVDSQSVKTADAGK